MNTPQPDITPILNDLAAGRIDTAEASRRIDALRSGAAEPVSPPTPDEPETQWATYEPPREERRRAGTHGVERVSVRAVGRRVRIVGDPAVATAAVDGPHVLRRTGNALEVASDGDIGPNLDGFTLLRPPRSFDDLRAMGLGKELLVRVNPALVVDVEVTAGTLTTERVPYLGKVRLTAGAANMSDVAEAADVLVQAGQANLSGTVTTGRSRIRVESGQLNVRLDDASNVTVRGEANLGRVSWTGGHSGAGDEVVMGNGSARLDVSVVMGHALVRVGEGDDR